MAGTGLCVCYLGGGGGLFGFPHPTPVTYVTWFHILDRTKHASSQCGISSFYLIISFELNEMFLDEVVSNTRKGAVTSLKSRGKIAGRDKMNKAGKTECKEKENRNKRSKQRKRGEPNTLLYSFAPVGGGVGEHKYVILKIPQS